MLLQRRAFHAERRERRRAGSEDLEQEGAGKLRVLRRLAQTVLTWQQHPLAEQSTELRPRPVAA